MDRSSSRLMHLDKKSGEIQHTDFKHIVHYLKPGDCLVINDTRVIPARLYGSKIGTDAGIEILLLKRKENNIWETLVKPGKKGKAGHKIQLRRWTFNRRSAGYCRRGKPSHSVFL